MTNLDILKKSIFDLKNYWSIALLASIPLTVLPSFVLINQTLGLLVILLLTGVLRAGISKIALHIVTNNNPKITFIFDVFSYYKNTLGVFLLSMLFIVLGLVCFIVPGIIAMLWLSQAFFILVENPTLEPLEVFKQSKELIKGKELKYLILLLLFALISGIFIVLNLMFLTFLLAPVQYIVFANFYNYLKNNQL